MTFYVRVMLCGAMTLLASCQTAPRASQTIITATEDAVYRKAVCERDKVILVSRDDKLTFITGEAIGDHNNDIWCACADKRPAGFDSSICKVQPAG